METLSPLLAILLGNLLVTGRFESPSQSPVKQSVESLFGVSLNNLLNKQSEYPDLRHMKVIYYCISMKILNIKMAYFQQMNSHDKISRPHHSLILIIAAIYLKKDVVHIYTGP